jgi:hypothetical protein
MAPGIVDNPPLFDLIQGSKASEADKVIVQAAISNAWGLSGAVEIIHWLGARWRAPNLITPAKANLGNASQGHSTA